MISLKDLLFPHGITQVKESIYNTLSDLNLPVKAWQPGSVVRTIISAFAVVFDIALQNQNTLARNGFWRYVEHRGWASLLAEQTYGYIPREATFASGMLTIFNDSGYHHTNIDPGDITVSSSTNNRTYVNTSTIESIEPFQTITAHFRAVEAGSASSVQTDGVDTLVTLLSGLTVRNEQPWVGLDEESIEEIRVACQASLDSKSPAGPASAYEAAARGALRQDGSEIGATRFLTVATDGDVILYCATASGGVLGDAMDPATDLGAIAIAMQKWAVPTGIVALPVSATVVSVPVEYTAYFRTTSGMTTDDRKVAIANALSRFFATEPIGGHVIAPSTGRVFAEAITTVIHTATPGCIKVELHAPISDVDMSISSVVVLGDVDGTIEVVS